MATPEIVLDRTGFPMVRIAALDAYLHWIPVTKIQFEHFMAAISESQFDSRWYDEILDLNPRVTPTAIRANNYWQAFLTGIRPAEAQRFAQWSGSEYGIPTLEEWNTAYRELKELPNYQLDKLDGLQGLGVRTQTLINRLDLVGRDVTEKIGGYTPRTLADQMLMRLGVMEWVECVTQRVRWGGMGITHPVFYGALQTPDHGQPMLPINPETNRLPHFGFRLIKRSE